MLEFSSDKELPKIHKADLVEGITKSIQSSEPTLRRIENEALNIETKDVPSEIAKALSKVVPFTQELTRQYKYLESKGLKSSEDEITKVGPLKNEIKRLEEIDGTYLQPGRGAGEGYEITRKILSIIFTLGTNPDYLQDDYDDHVRTAYWARRELPEKRSELNFIETKSAIDGKNIQKNLTARLFLPVLYLLRAEHGLRNYHQLESYAKTHHTDADSLMMYMRHSDPDCAMSLIHLLRADYSLKDIEKLRTYAATVEITDAPEQRAVLQFINHALVPHIDYFEIWASKIDDVINLKGEIVTSLKEHKADIPRLEILGQKSVQLSGRIKEQQAIDLPNTPKTIDALAFGNKQQNDARDQVKAMISDLNDPNKGDLKMRHQAVKTKALKEIEKFNHFFRDMDKTLRKIDGTLNQKNTERGKTWQAFLGAEIVTNQIEVLNFNSPENMKKFRRKILWQSAGARLLGGDVSLFGELFAGGIQNYHTNERYKTEFEIRMKSLVARQNGDPEQLKKELDVLDQDIEKLLEDKEFNTFLAQTGALENVRSVYMLLTRIVAGESNIDALESYTQIAGYPKVDNFISELKGAEPRLGKAMEKFLFGFADSNDLEVILAEGNRIKNPQKPAESVLLDYVEEIIKPHFNDMSRQASIVDHLQMRNSLYTGHDFHSFGEVVKKETDSALRALLSGKGDFTLVGSNDIHQLFGYYLARHGEETFVDLHNRNQRKPKVIESSKAADLQIKNKEIISARDENTTIPRLVSAETPNLSNIFAERCTSEYLLTQGVNIIKDKRLASSPQVLGAMEMVNESVKTLVKKLALSDAWNRQGQPPKRIGGLVEGLIADSCVQFFSELGAIHHYDSLIQDKLRMLKNAYAGENFALSHSLYTKAITNSADQGFELFLNIYRRNLESYLKTATRENRALLQEQLEQVKDIVKEIQLNDDIMMPDSEDARLRAHYRNHSLRNVGLNHETWVMRTKAINNESQQLGS